MNTIQLFVLSEEQHSLISVVDPDAENAIIEVSVDETYESVCVGYDYYENGTLVAKNCTESEMPFTYDDRAQKSARKVCAFINNDDAVISFLAGESDVEETGSLGHRSPPSNEDQTAGDMKSCAESLLLDLITKENIYPCRASHTQQSRSVVNKPFSFYLTSTPLSEKRQSPSEECGCEKTYICFISPRPPCIKEFCTIRILCAAFVVGNIFRVSHPD